MVARREGGGGAVDGGAPVPWLKEPRAGQKEIEKDSSKDLSSLRMDMAKPDDSGTLTGRLFLLGCCHSGLFLSPFA